MTEFSDLRRMMVDGQLRTFDIQDSTVLDAMGRVPREFFVDDSERALAYADRGVPFKEGARSLLSPMVLARMLQAAKIKKGERALDISGATGYAGAVLRDMGCRVAAWEPDTAFRARMKESYVNAGFADIDVLGGDDISGLPAHGLFDVILVNGCCEEEPAALFPLLAEGGRLIVIMKNSAAQSVRVFQRSGNEIGSSFVGHGNGPMIDLFSRKAAFVF